MTAPREVRRHAPPMSVVRQGRPLTPPPGLSWDDDAEREERDDPVTENSDQVVDALLALDRPESAYLRMPWPSLDAMVSGIAPGDVWFVAAFSGQGKTTFLTSALNEWFEAGRRVYVMGLESRPNILRTHWACKRLDVDAGELLTGDVFKRPDAEQIRAAVRAEVMSQAHGEKFQRVRFSRAEFMNLPALVRDAERAAAWGADLMIVDHIDHIEGGDGSNPFEESRRVLRNVLKLAQHTGLRMLVATQLNNDVARGHDRLAMYQPPRPEHVFMGGTKRQIASGMIGLYRPLRAPMRDESPDAYKLAMMAARRGEAEPQTALEPNRMGVVVMKHRAFGAREGKRCALGVERGRVVELPPRDQPTALTRGELTR